MSKSLQFNFPGMTKPEAKRDIIGQHACEVCGGRASFAYGHSELRNVQGRWRCFSHRLGTEAKGEAA